MKKLLLLFTAVVFTSVCYSQYSQGFETGETFTYGYLFGDSTGLTVTNEVNPGANGTNTNASTMVTKIVKASGTVDWHSLQINDQSLNIDDTDGKFFTLSFRTSQTDGNMNLRLENAGREVTAHYTGLAIDTWHDITFDFTSIADFSTTYVGIITDLYQLDGVTRTGNSTSETTYYFDNIQQSTTLSADNKSFKVIKVFPNPVKDEINLADHQNYKSVSIYNLLGQEVKQVESQKTIDVSDLTSGVYVINTDNKISTKFVKE